MLGIDRRTVVSSAKSVQLTNRVREWLERALQYGVGSAAESLDAGEPTSRSVWLP